MNSKMMFVALTLIIAVGAVCAAQDLEAKGKTLTLMHIQVADATRTAVANAVKRFEKATGANVTVEAIKNDPFKQKLNVALPSNSPPDVFHTWGGGVFADFVKRGLVAPIPDDFPVGGIRPQALEFCKVDGKLYAVPTDLSIVCFWYRKSLFAKHGIDLPKTFGELVQACLKLEGAGLTPIALGNVEHWPGAFYFDYLVLRLGGAAEYVTKSSAAGQPEKTPATRVAARLTQALVAAGAFPDGFSGLNYGQSRGILFKGDAAMTLMGTWLLSYAISDRPEVLADLALFPFPAVGGGPGPQALLGGTNAAYAISAKCKHKELAGKLVQFLTDEAAATDWSATRIPARKIDMPNPPPALTETLKLIEGTSQVQLYYDQALTPAAAAKHKPYTQSVFVPEPPRAWPRLLVGVIAVLVLLFVALALRSSFRSGR